MPLPIQVKLLRLENEWSQDLHGLQIYKKGTDQRKKSNTKTWTRRFRKSKWWHQWRPDQVGIQAEVWRELTLITSP